MFFPVLTPKIEKKIVYYLKEANCLDAYIRVVLTFFLNTINSNFIALNGKTMIKDNIYKF